MKKILFAVASLCLYLAVARGQSVTGVPNASSATSAGGTPGDGTVTSVAQTVPTWLTVGGSPITGAGTLAITAATAQISHKVIGTCGTATSFAPCSLVIGDLPAITSGSSVQKGDGSGYLTSATGADIVALFGTCSGTQYLGADAACHSTSGSGSVTSVALTMPAWLTVGGSPVTTSGTLAVTATTAQTSHQVIGTCGTFTTFAPCSLVAGDIPTLNQNTTGNAATATDLASYPATCTGGQFSQGLTHASNNCGTPSGGGGGTGNAAALETVTFSATPTFTCPSSSAGTVVDFEMSTALSANITSSTLASCTTGSALNFSFTQASSGGPYTVAMPTGFAQACQVSPIASSITNMAFFWDGSTAQLTGCHTNVAPSIASEVSFPSGTPASGTQWTAADSTTHAQRNEDSSGNFYGMSKELTAGNIRAAGGADANDTAATQTQLLAVCTHCTTSTSPGAGVAHFAGSTQDMTSSLVATGDMAANAVTSAKTAVVNTYRVCDIPVGDTSASALTNAQLGPQSRVCFVPAASTIVEMDVNADASTPNVIVARNHSGTIANIVSGALATAASGGIACTNTGGTTGINGATTCTNTLQNTSLSAGDYLELVSGTAGGTAKFFVVHVVYTVN